MVAGQLDLVIEQGVQFADEFFYVNNQNIGYDLSGTTAQCQGRLNINSTGTLFDFSTQSGTIVITGSLIAFKVPLSVTSGLNFNQGIYDLKLFNNGSVANRLLQGNVTLSRAVTR
jgi:hypothetical protein